MVNHWDLDSEAFRKWSIKKIADIVMSEQIEDFCRNMPPEELKRLYHILEDRIIPILWEEGFPIGREDCFEIFRSWFARIATTKNQQPDKTPSDSTESRIISLFF